MCHNSTTCDVGGQSDLNAFVTRTTVRSSRGIATTATAQSWVQRGSIGNQKVARYIITDFELEVNLGPDCVAPKFSCVSLSSSLR